MKPTLTIVGSSVRAAAASAVRAGYQVRAADLFADVDLCTISQATSVREYPRGLADVVAGSQAGGWMYTGALENHPPLVDRMAAVRPLYGNRAAVLRAVRNPRLVARAIADAGLTYPPVAFSSAEATNRGRCLQKPRRSAGGANVEFWKPGAPVPRGCYLQQYMPGVPHSAAYVAASGTAALLGVTRQLVGSHWTGGVGFRYCGSIGPVPISAAANATFRAIGEVLARSFDLVGLFGVDAIVAGDNVWPVEVNPRYTASMEVLERALDFSAVLCHVAACRREPALDFRRTGGRRVEGKAIVFAADDRVVDKLTVPLRSVELADIPQPGSAIRSGWPVVSILAGGTSERDVLSRLKQAAQQLALPKRLADTADDEVGLNNAAERKEKSG